jgi:outer membrane protein OmpA-like peptidoglycan-associated protein
MKRFTLALALVLVSASASAQLVQQASKDDLIEKLTPPAPPATRSLRNIAPKPVNVDLSINFDFDSARLQASSKPLLDNLAQAMNSERLGASSSKWKATPMPKARPITTKSCHHAEPLPFKLI